MAYKKPKLPRINTYKKTGEGGGLLLTRIQSPMDFSRGRSMSQSILSFAKDFGLRPVVRGVAKALLCTALFALSLSAQYKREVIIEQDAAGPGGTDMQSILALVNSPDTDVLGITVLTGDAWREEEAHPHLRLMEIIGRPASPVVPGAGFPLVNRKEYIENWVSFYGKLRYK